MGNWISNPEDTWLARWQKEQSARKARLARILKEQSDRAAQEEQRRKREYYRVLEQQLGQQSLQRNVEELQRYFEKLHIQESRIIFVRSETQPKLITVNKSVVEDVLQITAYKFMKNDVSNCFPYKLLPLTNEEYTSVKKIFTDRNKYCQVTNIVKIFNPYLWMQYELMRDKYIQRYGQVNEKMLFHGTELAKVDNICKYNFDWRLNGRSVGHKFGQGVSFSPSSQYATHYGDKTNNKVMLVVSVLVSKQCVGNKNMVLPEDKCDTTTNKNETVFVKYEDNTFCPLFIIFYQD